MTQELSLHGWNEQSEGLALDFLRSPRDAVSLFRGSQRWRGDSARCLQTDRTGSIQAHAMKRCC